MHAQSGVLTPRTQEVCEAIADGATPDEAARTLNISVASVNRHIDRARTMMQVRSLRALVYVLESRQLANRPERAAKLVLDPLTELVWAGLRLDVPDRTLVPELAASARVDPDELRSALDQLTEQYQTSWHGLIRLGFRHGVLSGKEGADLGGPRAGHGGSGGPWSLKPIRHRVLELLASGLSAEGSVRRTGISKSTVYTHLRACAQVAGVKAHRALIHEALRAEVLVRPAPVRAPDQSKALAAVWRGLVLDVPDRHLADAISRQTGLPVRDVKLELERVRSTGMPDCRLVVAGWQYGFLDEQTTVLAPPEHLSVVARAGAGPMTLHVRERQLLALMAVEGLTVEQAGARMDVTPGTARTYLRDCLLSAKARSVRTLTHKACLQRLLPSGQPEERDVPDDVRTVWRALALDTPDDRLVRDIASVTGLPQYRVQECLSELRARGLTDCQLIVEGWARQILDAQARLTPPRLETRLTAPLPRRAAHSGRNPEDPLELVPSGHRWEPESELVADCTGLAGRHLVGDCYDFVRITPEACRTLLERTDEDRWGPVLGLPAARTAVLVTEAGSDGPTRHGAVGRLWARGGVVRLPEPGRRTTPDGAYWAVPAHLPLWKHDLIARVLDPSPATDQGVLQVVGRPT
ncbi:LuxR C-terminal-related transcriptional regulator [Streptomyces sp. NPDC057565]|uniref:LuxR C-terminal-related transcriptional regulator n=1 Tax=Streptomyces sp. NPDC057565 TaxID=3346169 RepID=UPI0036A7D429